MGEQAIESQNDEERSLPEQVTTTPVDDIQDETVQTWLVPRQNLWRLISVIWGFLVLGMSDATLGVLLPSLEQYYDINYLVASVSFVAPFCGYIVSALMCDFMHRKLGRWGCSILAPSLQLVCYIICICKPPYPVFVIAYGIAGLGNGMIDAAWNAWASMLQNSNTIMGFIHGAYGLGGTLCPTIFTAMMGTGISWNICYSVMIAVGGVSVSLAATCWWGDTPRLYCSDMDNSSDASEKNVKDDKSKASIRQVLSVKVVWLLASILFLYVGTEVAIGGWTSTFMIVERGMDRSKSGYSTTGFWAGMTVGRIVLGFVTEKIRREEISLAVYLSVALAMAVVFWTVKVIVVSAVCIALVGVFTGPAFPIIMVVAAKKLPKRLHVSGLGLIASLGGAGAAVLPFVNGIINEAVGPRALGPYAFTALAVMIVGWGFLIKFF